VRKLWEKIGAEGTRVEKIRRIKAGKGSRRKMIIVRIGSAEEKKKKMQNKVKEGERKYG